MFLSCLSLIGRYGLLYLPASFLVVSYSCLMFLLSAACSIASARLLMYFRLSILHSSLWIYQKGDTVLFSFYSCLHPVFLQIEFGNQQVVVGCHVYSSIHLYIFKWPPKSLSYANVIYLVLCQMIRWYPCGLVDHLMCKHATPNGNVLQCTCVRKSLSVLVHLSYTMGSHHFFISFVVLIL